MYDDDCDDNDCADDVYNATEVSFFYGIVSIQEAFEIADYLVNG